MAASKKTSAKKPVARQPSGTSVRALAIRRELDGLTKEFVAWFNADGGDDTAAALHVLDEAATVLGLVVDGGFEAAATVFDADPLLDAADAAMSAEPDDEKAAFTLTALRTYVEFLEETGRWEGSPEGLEEVQELLFLGARDRMGGFTFDLPELSESDELAALAGTVLVRSAEGILAWLAGGQAIDASQEFPQPADQPGLVAAAGTGHAVAIWAAMVELELIQIDGDRAVSAPAAQAFLAGSAEDRVVELRGLASLAMAELVEESPSELDNREVAESITVGVLSLATSAEPLEMDQVFARAEGDGEDAGVARFVQQALRAMADLGLLTLDGHVVMEPFAVRALAETFGGDYD